MGVTSVGFMDYALGGLAMLPGTIVYVSIGTTIGSIQDVATGNYDTGVVGLGGAVGGGDGPGAAGMEGVGPG